jgi:hypothetical protein
LLRPPSPGSLGRLTHCNQALGFGGAMCAQPPYLRFNLALTLFSLTRPLPQHYRIDWFISK